EADVAAHYGGILSERARTGRNGARWQIDTVTSLEVRGAGRPEALAEMTRLYRAAVDSGDPVHAWPVPARQRGCSRRGHPRPRTPPADAPTPSHPQASVWRTAISQVGTMRGMTPSSPTTEDPRGTAPSAARTSEDRSARIAVTVFPALILAAAAFGFFVPAVGQSLAQFTSIYLGIIMFAMGLTLTVPDFALVARRPLPILIGVVAQ